MPENPTDPTVSPVPLTVPVSGMDSADFTRLFTDFTAALKIKTDEEVETKVELTGIKNNISQVLSVITAYIKDQKPSVRQRHKKTEDVVQLTILKDIQKSLTEGLPDAFNNLAKEIKDFASSKGNLTEISKTAASKTPSSIKSTSSTYKLEGLDKLPELTTISDIFGKLYEKLKSIGQPIEKIQEDIINTLSQPSVELSELIKKEKELNTIINIRQLAQNKLNKTFENLQQLGYNTKLFQKILVDFPDEFTRIQEVSELAFDLINDRIRRNMKTLERYGVNTDKIKTKIQGLFNVPGTDQFEKNLLDITQEINRITSKSIGFYHITESLRDQGIESEKINKLLQEYNNLIQKNQNIDELEKELKSRTKGLQIQTEFIKSIETTIEEMRELGLKTDKFEKTLKNIPITFNKLGPKETKVFRDSQKDLKQQNVEQRAKIKQNIDNLVLQGKMTDKQHEKVMTIIQSEETSTLKLNSLLKSTSRQVAMTLDETLSKLYSWFMKIGGFITGGEMIKNIFVLEKMSTNLAVVMGGFLEQNRAFSDQLQIQATSVARTSGFLTNALDVAKAQSSLFEIGINKLEDFDNILNVSASAASGMNIDFKELADYTGQMAFDLRLSGQQITAVQRRLSGITKDFGFSTKKVMEIQKGVGNLLQDLRKTQPVTASMANNITTLFAAIERSRGSKEAVDKITKAFGNLNDYLEGMQSNGLVIGRTTQNLFNIMRSELKYNAMSAGQIMSTIRAGAMTGTTELFQAEAKTLEDILQQAKKSGANMDMTINRMTQGLFKGSQELQLTINGLNEAAARLDPKFFDELADGMENLNKAMKEGTDQFKLHEQFEKLFNVKLEPKINIDEKMLNNQFKEIKSGLITDMGTALSDFQSKITPTTPGKDIQKLVQESGLDKKISGLIQAGNVIHQDTTGLAQLQKGFKDANTVQSIKDLTETIQKQMFEDARAKSELSLKDVIDSINQGKIAVQNLGVSLGSALDRVLGGDIFRKISWFLGVAGQALAFIAGPLMLAKYVMDTLCLKAIAMNTGEQTALKVLKNTFSRQGIFWKTGAALLGSPAAPIILGLVAVGAGIYLLHKYFKDKDDAAMQAQKELNKYNTTISQRADEIAANTKQLYGEKKISAGTLNTMLIQKDLHKRVKDLSDTFTPQYKAARTGTLSHAPTSTMDWGGKFWDKIYNVSSTMTDDFKIISTKFSQSMRKQDDLIKIYERFKSGEIKKNTAELQMRQIIPNKNGIEGISVDNAENYIQQISKFAQDEMKASLNQMQTQFDQSGPDPLVKSVKDALNANNQYAIKLFREQEIREYQSGGYVNAPRGIPVPATVHGGEFVLSEKMFENLNESIINMNKSFSLAPRPQIMTTVRDNIGGSQIPINVKSQDENNQQNIEQTSLLTTMTNLTQTQISILKSIASSLNKTPRTVDNTKTISGSALNERNPKTSNTLGGPQNRGGNTNNGSWMTPSVYGDTQLSQI